ncbi:serine/threonine protein kinase [Streptomyces fumigatiscleroticus]|nr:serine/threonine protein kinase [Streptomyces fumigatiscleroticus]
MVLADRYRLDALLGRGGAADVHEGLDLRLGRPVAVKVFRPDGDARSEERFTEEAVLLAGLQHPGLVTVYDSGRENGSSFLVMQLIEGPTLRGRIAGGVLDAAGTCVLGAALADALDHVHGAGVVHRDVKPSNILLDETGAPHLTDFGISRPIDSSVRTDGGPLVGTAAYLAPEQVLGRGAGPAADVYALGLTLLECLKGTREYDGAPLEAAIARLHRPPVLPPCLDGRLVRLLRAMTALEEDDRPDARTCARALTELGRVPVVPRARRAGAGSASVFSRAAGEVSSARRRGGRTFASAGAALATLLGAALTGSVGDLPDRSAGTAPGTDSPGHATPDAEPPGSPGRHATHQAPQQAPERRQTPEQRGDR